MRFLLIYKLLITANPLKIKYCLANKIKDNKANKSETKENKIKVNNNFKDYNKII